MAIDTKLFMNKIKPNLWANKDYKIFFYNFVLNAKRHRGLIDISDRIGWNKKSRISYAEDELSKIKGQRKNNIYDSKLTLNKYMDKHFEHQKDSTWKKNKVGFYNFNIRKSSLGKKLLSDVKPLDIKDMMLVLRNRGLKEGSVYRLLEVLKPAFREAVENRIIDFNPTISLKVKIPSTKKIVTNASEELKKIYEAINNEYFHDPFYKCFFYFGLQGRRRSEIMHLKWEDIDFKNNLYILRHTKNNEEQRIFLSEDIKELLLKFKDDTNKYVFTSRYTGTHINSIQHQINKLKSRLYNPNFSLHYLRNVVVSAMAESGLESIYLSGALGHNDPNTIKKYLTMNYLRSSQKASDVINEIVNKPHCLSL